jgi:hypothetical protein
MNSPLIRRVRAGATLTLLARTAALVALLTVASLAGSPAGTAAQAAATATLVTAAVPTAAPTMSDCPEGISSVPAGDFRVWACDNDDYGGYVADEQTVADEAAAIYGPMTDLMGDPLPDCQSGVKKGPLACGSNGGDGKIDIYLVEPGQTVRRGGKPWGLAGKLGEEGSLQGQAVSTLAPNPPYPHSSSGFILLRREMLSAQPTTFMAVLIHEFFHVLQYRYNSGAGCRPGRYWFYDASATWAELYFGAERGLALTGAKTDVYPWFRDFQKQPQISLTDVTHRDAYSDFVWPLYMQQKTGRASVIAATWEALAGATTCAQMTAAMNTVFSFAGNFGGFAVENFDTRLKDEISGELAWPTNFGDDYPDYLEGADFPEVQPKTGYPALTVNPAYPAKETADVDLPPLSAQYTVFSFAPPPQQCTQEYPWTCTDGSLVFDFSRLTPKSELDVNLLGSEDTPGASRKDVPHNGEWLHAKVLDGKASVCVNVDTGGKGGTKTTWYVIVDNRASGDSAVPITGTYTVEQRNACATSLKGTVTTDWQQDVSSNNGTYAYSDENELDLQLDDSATGWSVAPGSTWSVPAFTDVSTGVVCSDGTTGTSTTTLGQTHGNMGSGDALLFAYDGAYSGHGSKLPLFWGSLLDEPVPATTTYCGQTSSTTVVLSTNGQCMNNTNTGVGLYGGYQADDAKIRFDCAWGPTPPQGGETFSLSITGTLSATDPLTCGLWSTDCSVSSPSAAAEQPGRSRGIGLPGPAGRQGARGGYTLSPHGARQRRRGAPLGVMLRRPSGTARRRWRGCGRGP